jgi:hypothetical protein
MKYFEISVRAVLLRDSLQYQVVFTNLGVFPRSGNINFVLCKRPLRQIMERFTLVGLYFGIVLIFMQDEETNSISANHAVDDLISRLTGLAHDRASDCVPVLAQHKDVFATVRPLSAEVGQGWDSSQKQHYTRSKNHLKFILGAK